MKTKKTIHKAFGKWHVLASYGDLWACGEGTDLDADNYETREGGQLLVRAASDILIIIYQYLQKNEQR